MKNVADEIGTLRASIAELQSELKILENAVKYNAVNSNHGSIVMDGELYRVVVATSPRLSVSWKNVAVALGATQSTISRFTTESDVTKITCSARLCQAA